MPEIVEVGERPYVALRGKVAMDGIGAFADRMRDVIDWLAAHEIAPNDAPFFKYDVVDMESGLVMEIGFPVDDLHHGEGEIVTGVLPAGRIRERELPRPPRRPPERHPRPARLGLLPRGWSGTRTATTGPPAWRSTSPTPARSRTWTTGTPSSSSS